jgi:hypothetical protein
MKITVDGLDAIVVELGAQPQNIQRASVRAMNRGIKSGRTLMVRNIADDLHLKGATVRDTLVMKEATVTSPDASLAASLKRIPLINFVSIGQQVAHAKGTARGTGVAYQLAGTSGRVDNAFIRIMPSGHVGVFVRAGKARLPIRELFGPSLGHVFNKYRPEVLDRVIEMFQRNFGHELEVETNGFIKAGPGETGTPDESDVAA